MKSFIVTYVDGKPMCGSDWSYPVKGTSLQQINNAMTVQSKRLSMLSQSIYPFLLKGVVEIALEKQSGKPQFKKRVIL